MRAEEPKVDVDFEEDEHFGLTKVTVKGPGGETLLEVKADGTVEDHLGDQPTEVQQIARSFAAMVNAPSLTATRLSKMLFSAREGIEMLADIIEKRTGRPDSAHRRLVTEIDEFRAEQGWSLDGYGGEG